MGSQSQSDVPAGALFSQNTWGEYSNVMFAVQQALGKMQTATIVRVVSCTNDGDVSPVGLVDVLPLVNQVDALGKATKHITVYNIPYLRVQGGSDAVIIDPKAGDLGICVFSNRDLSNVKSTKDQANPGSFRQFSFSDGLYMGGILNGAPTQYVRFNDEGIDIVSPAKITLSAPNEENDEPTQYVRLSSEGIEIVSPTKITLSAPDVEIDGELTQGKGPRGGACAMLGDLTVDGDVIATGTHTHTHVHPDAQGGKTGSPE